MHRTTRALSKILVLSESDVKKCLPVSAAIEVNRKALGSLRSATAPHKKSAAQHDNARVSHQKQGAFVPTRIGLPYYRQNNKNNMAGGSDDDGAEDWTLFKPAAYYPPLSTNNDDDDEILMGIKLVSVRANNPSQGKPLVPANVMLVDAQSGEVNALLGGTHLTALRTAAGSAVATELCLLGQQQHHHLVMFGAGLQAKQHLQTICAVCNVEELTIVNRTMKRAEEWKESILSDTTIKHINVIQLQDINNVKRAVNNANIICTTTNSTNPLFCGDWVNPGCHINCIGAYTPFMREVDEALVDRCEVFLDTMEAIDAGDLKHLILRRTEEQEEVGSVRFGNVSGLLGDLIAGDASVGNAGGSVGASIDCTMFKSVGTAIQDIMTAHEAVKRAKLLGIGQEIDL